MGILKSKTTPLPQSKQASLKTSSYSKIIDLEFFVEKVCPLFLKFSKFKSLSWVYKPCTKTHNSCASVDFLQILFKNSQFLCVCRILHQNSQILCVIRVFTNPTQEFTHILIVLSNFKTLNLFLNFLYLKILKFFTNYLI